MRRMDRVVGRCVVLLAGLLCVLSLPRVGLAFSLGELQMQSRPGQPFQAQAPVKLNKDERIASVALGTPADYSLLNLPYSPAIEGIKAQVREQSGATFVSLQGVAPIVEDDFFILLRVSSNQNTFYPFFRIHSAATAAQEPKKVENKSESSAVAKADPLLPTERAAREKAVAEKEQKSQEKSVEKVVPEKEPKMKEKSVEKAPVAGKEPAATSTEAGAARTKSASVPGVAASGASTEGAKVEGSALSAKESRASLAERKSVERKEAPAQPMKEASAVKEASIVPMEESQERAVEKGTTYGPVREGENLTEIVHKLKLVSNPSSFFQAVVAIWQKNPDQFIHNNMNGLKSGVMLQIPSRQEIARIPVREARKLRLSHAMEWKKPLDGQQDMDKVDLSLFAKGEEAPLSAGGLSAAKTDVSGGGSKRSGGALGGETEELRAILLQLQVITRVLESNQAQQERLEQRISTLEQARKEWDFLRERINSLEMVKGGVARTSGAAESSMRTPGNGSESSMGRTPGSSEGGASTGSWWGELDTIATGAMALVVVALIGLLALSVGRRVNQKQQRKNLQSLLSEASRQDAPLLRDSLQPGETANKGSGKAEALSAAAEVANQLESLTRNKSS
ncbi:FimV/HubP family polar landmark protein [Candidatus Magnetaquicoccus inordinatus]|uniref:FimV/HubP family polar landmark protein n=1 Tax=Candidatus Magnetaquicoccus inordinatus TaxID=2496818 RepID=UPI00187D5695|nr:FimV/HubP family polar landmark protein [Candidatus Magnetaquicoccus inordinatus]